MYMGAAVGPLKHPGNQNIIVPQGSAADRAIPFNITVKAVNTAPNMHQPVPAPGNGRKRQCFYQLPPVQP
jgi:hypothetical protein